MKISLDQVTVDKIKGLKMGYKDEPQPELLIPIPNHDPDVEYEIEIVTNEFTSLCPLNTSQPDYATIMVKYVPMDTTVELKSLKFYLVSFRQVPIFHESVPATILKDLVNILHPVSMEVVGQFSTRGGLDTTVRAVYSSQNES